LTQNVQGIMSNDSVIIKVKEGTPLTAMIPSITHTGSAITPGSGIAQNFTNTVVYTVTAADGSEKEYKVVVSFASSEKKILSFDIESVNNPGLNSDITGRIEGDTILLLVPAPISISNLRPTINHTGKSISPASQEPKDFTLPLKYTVTAEDETTKEYVVMASQDSVLYVGNTDGKLYALDAINGKLLWSYQTNGAIISSPVLYKGNIYFGNGDRYVYAINAKSGSLSWSYRADHPVEASPTVKNDVLYISCAQSNVSKGYTFALDALTGNLKWRSQDILYGPLSPTVGTEAVYTNAWASSIHALDINTGTTIWVDNSGGARARPAFKDGVLYGGGEYSNMFAIDALTGNAIWKSPAKFGGATTPVIVDGKIYLSLQPAICLDAATGDTLWMGNDITPTSLGTPSYYNGFLYMTAAFGDVIAVDASNGNVKWKFSEDPASRTNFHRPNTTVSYTTVYAPGNNNYFYALELATGRVRWKYKMSGDTYGGPCVVNANNQIFHSGNSGNRE